MNRPIVRLFGLVIVMFAVLLAFTSRWTIFEASSLRHNPLNARALLEQQRIARGRILAADGTVLARSVRSSASSRSESVYERRYPTGNEFAHAIGYYFTNLGSAGLERYRNGALNGQSPNNLQTILDQLQGKKRQGDEVVTTLDPKAQQVANKALAGHEGAVVALEPRDGAVRVMASSPAYDPNALRSTRTYEALARDSHGKPLVNRATQFGYAPGSTFKVVTATAAIDSGAFSKESTVDGRNKVPISGVPLQNDENETFGPITLVQGLAKSVNTVWAQVAERLGKATLARYMRRFGFDKKPQLDYPAEEMSSSGEYIGGRVIAPTSARVDVGRMGIGQ
ncbi:MAG TPA: penicillin-binding transpeptidase domain-containing protein, partial [Solirubrobacteraceae bacterium]